MSVFPKACAFPYATRYIWMKVKLREAGYQQTDTECVCGHVADDLLHRIWECPAAGEVRDNIVNGEELQMIKDYVKEPGSPFYAGLQLEVRGRVRQIEGTGAEAGKCWCVDPGQTPSGALQGQLYTDGSCFKSECGPYKSVGWAVVKLDEACEVYAALWGPVGRNLPQSSPAAEYVAVQAATAHGKGDRVLGADYTGAVGVFQQGQERCLDKRSIYAGLKLHIIGRPGWKGIKAIEKV
jgi:hypothetical protein